MPLPLILNKVLSFGFKTTQAILTLSNPGFYNLEAADFIAQRLGFKQGSTISTIIKNAKLSYLAISGAALVIGGGALALAGLASLGIVGSLTAGLIGASAIGFSLTQLVSIVANTTNFIINFNINQTDEELDKILAQKIEGFYGLLGDVVGSSMGYLVCGALPGAFAFAFNPAVGAAVLRDLDENVRDDVLAKVNGIARTAFQTMINAELSAKFKSSRRFLKKNPNNPFAKAVRGIMGEENWKKWGEANNKSFTIHQDVIEKRIDAIPDKGQREFVSKALEGFADSCLEAGYIVANNLDSQLAAQALMQRNVLGNQTDVVISFA